MALFALISLAGFTMLNGILGTRDRLDGRLARVAELQRAMYLMTLDLESMTEDPLDATADAVAFRRTSSVAAQGTMPVRYVLKGNGFHRLTGVDADQRVIRDVAGVQWRILDATGVWTTPAPGTSLADGDERPRAVEITLALEGESGGLSGPLRRVIELPRRP